MKEYSRSAVRAKTRKEISSELTELQSRGDYPPNDNFFLDDWFHYEESCYWDLEIPW
jgi:hypothetical protein